MNEHTGEAATALAALTICESLIALLMDRNVLTRDDVEDLLSDAAAVDSSAAETEVNAEAADIIRDVMDGLTARHH